MSGDTCPHCGAADELSEQRQRADDAERRLAEMTAERDRHLEIIKACRNGFNDLNPHGKTIFDFMNVWLDQGERRAEKAEHELAALKASIDEAPVAWVVFNESGEVGTIAHGDIVAISGNSTVKLCRMVAIVPTVGALYGVQRND